jgi:hypothetical protein
MLGSWCLILKFEGFAMHTQFIHVSNQHTGVKTVVIVSIVTESTTIQIRMWRSSGLSSTFLISFKSCFPLLSSFRQTGLGITDLHGFQSCPPLLRTFRRTCFCSANSKNIIWLISPQIRSAPSRMC